jgi:hypothetical protein
MTLPWVQHAFNGGEVGRDFLGRSDHARYEAACQTLENFVCLPLGPATRRPGTRFVAAAKYPDRAVRLLRFEFNVTQAYILEFGDHYLRIFLPEGRLEEPPGTPVEVATPYAASDLAGLQTAQDADVLWLAHPTYPVQQLIRYSATVWRLVPLRLRPPPSVEGETDLGVALTLSATSGLTVTATASTPVFYTADIDRVLELAPSATLIGGGAATITGLVGDLVPAAAVTLSVLDPFPQTTLPASSWVLTGSPVADCTPDKAQPVGGRITLRLSRVTGTSPNIARNGDFSAGLAEWTNLSSGTGTFTVSAGLASLSGGTGPGIGACDQYYGTPLLAAQYQVHFDVGGAPLAVMVGTTSGGSELFAEQSFPIGNDRTFTFTAPGASVVYLAFRNNQPTTATLDNVRLLQGSSDGFRPGDVGKYVKIRSGVVRLTRIVNAATAEGVILAPLLSDEPALAGTWSLEDVAWSATRGYPRALAFHQQRLWLAGTAAQPQTLWGSVLNQYRNFAAGVADTASVEYTLATNEMSVIDWLVPYRQLFIGTKGGEYLLQATSGILTPTNVEQEPQTTFGSSGLAPVRSHSILFLVQRGGRLVWELTFDDTFSARPRDLRLWTPALTAAGLVSLAFQRSPRAILWAVRQDGQLLGLTYDFFEQIQGWHRHTTLGQFLSVATCPVDPAVGEQTEQVWVAVRRTVQGQPVTYIEVLDPLIAVDSGLTYSGPPVTTLAGLDHLEGWTVAVCGDGADYGPHVVADGTITLAHPVSQAAVGLPMVSTLKPLPPEAGLRDGSLVGRRKRWVWVNVTLHGTATLEVNGTPVALRTVEDAMDVGVAPRDLGARASTLGWSREAGLALVARAPLPCTIVRLRGDLDVEEYG